MNPGNLVLIDGEVCATVRDYFPEGSSFHPWPYVLVDVGRSGRARRYPLPCDGDLGVKVALNRVAVSGRDCAACSLGQTWPKLEASDAKTARLRDACRKEGPDSAEAVTAVSSGATIEEQDQLERIRLEAGGTHDSIGYLKQMVGSLSGW